MRLNVSGKAIKQAKMKSPLPYFGGKSRAIRFLAPLVPAGTQELVSPFFGGGSFEIELARRGIKVYGYDGYEPLVNFWQFVLTNQRKIAADLRKLIPINYERVKAFVTRHLHDVDNNKRAVAFYLNTTLSFGCRVTRTVCLLKNELNYKRMYSKIEQLRTMPISGFSVEHSYFQTSLAKHPNALLYLDPPYYALGNMGYGVKAKFPHGALFGMLRTRKRWLLSYYDCDAIKTLYKGHAFLYPKYTYSALNIGGKKKENREIVILSHDLAKYHAQQRSSRFAALRENA